ncbi:MAG: hypothetical protein KTR25_02590 [Myxococcales bacterium]|nr:hypothetical protein [Myxococcales bacterium]
MLAYISPLSSSENSYIQIQKELLEELGFEVRPLSIASAIKGQCFGIFRRKNVIMVHWLENRLFKLGTPSRGLSVGGLLSFAGLSTLLLIARSKTLYFVHNHSVHDVPPQLVGLSQQVIGWLRSIADIRIVHDPTFVDQYQAQYLPHPLYGDLENQNTELSSSDHKTSSPQFLIIGTVRPYKNIHKFLHFWPENTPLSIAGKGPEEYVLLLKKIICERALNNTVSIDSRFFEDDEFMNLLNRHDVIILPHRQNANLVSGVFFAAIGRSRIILARETPFIAWVKKHIPGIYSFQNDEDIPSIVKEIQRDWPDLTRNSSSSAAASLFGTNVCLNAFRSLLKLDEDEQP